MDLPQNHQQIMASGCGDRNGANTQRLPPDQLERRRGPMPVLRALLCPREPQLRPIFHVVNKLQQRRGQLYTAVGDQAEFRAIRRGRNQASRR